MPFKKIHRFETKRHKTLSIIYLTNILGPSNECQPMRKNLHLIKLQWKATAGFLAGDGMARFTLLKISLWLLGGDLALGQREQLAGFVNYQ